MFFHHPNWKVCAVVKLDHFPRDRGEHEKIFALPPSLLLKSAACTPFKKNGLKDFFPFRMVTFQGRTVKLMDIQRQPPPGRKALRRDSEAHHGPLVMPEYSQLLNPYFPVGVRLGRLVGWLVGWPAIIRGSTRRTFLPPCSLEASRKERPLPPFSENASKIGQGAGCREENTYERLKARRKIAESPLNMCIYRNKWLYYEHWPKQRLFKTTLPCVTLGEVLPTFNGLAGVLCRLLS